MPATMLQRVPGGNVGRFTLPSESLKVGRWVFRNSAIRERSGFASQVIILLLEIGITGWLIRCPSGMRLGPSRCRKIRTFLPNCCVKINGPLVITSNHPKEFCPDRKLLFCLCVFFWQLQVELPCQGGEFQIVRNED